jgi:hypothetical protein
MDRFGTWAAAMCVGLAVQIVDLSAQPSVDQVPAATPAVPDPKPPAAQVPAAPDTKPAAISAPAPADKPLADKLCRTIEEAAADNGLPVEFFTRLIWQESRFDPNAQSSKGAQGIAQFMPRTAGGRGLLTPFEPVEALRESASYLAELRKTFGNLGLAAAAYNAGPGRVDGWLKGRGGLPAETRAYVRIITGRGADEWSSPTPPSWEGAEIPHGVPCAQLVNLMRSTPVRAASQGNPIWAPWGVQLAGNWSQGRVLASYEQLRRRYSSILGDHLPLVLSARGAGRGSAVRHLVRVGENSRQDADKLCGKLRSAGAACIVLRNPRRLS